MKKLKCLSSQKILIAPHHSPLLSHKRCPFPSLSQRRSTLTPSLLMTR